MSGSPKTFVGGSAGPLAGAAPAAAGAAPPARGAPAAAGAAGPPSAPAATAAATTPAASTALDEVHVRSRGIVDQAEARRIRCGEDVDDARLGIERAAFPVRSTRGVGQHQRAGFAPFAWRDRRREDRTDLVEARDAQRLGLQLRRPVDQIRFRDALSIEWRRFGRKGLRRRIPLARHVPFFHRLLDDRPHRLSRHAIERVDPALLRRHADRLDGFSIDGDVHQDSGSREVPVPDVVVDRLEVPVAFAGVEVEADDAVGEQIVARTMTAVVVTGRHFRGEVHAIRSFVDRDGAPVAGVARVRPRIVQPRVVAFLAGLRNRVEDPEALARAHVVSADVALDVFFRTRRAAGRVGGADDDDVVADRGRRVEPDICRRQVDSRLIELCLEVDDPVPAKRWNRHAGFRVQRDEVIAGRDSENALVSLAIGPVRDASPRSLARRTFTALALVHAPHPQLLARFGVDAPRPRGALLPART